MKLLKFDKIPIKNGFYLLIYNHPKIRLAGKVVNNDKFVVALTDEMNNWYNLDFAILDSVGFVLSTNDYKKVQELIDKLS